ncbi:hypothetical protein HAX54_040524 [Datura stramonium]|uniref:Uncharacterized protein n=1 Tax=Datura stramonium TaxID=4076 RepID=A0ABS8VSR1_DATST|nr:hypothetical protein [Datura stramonium]
MEDFYITFKKKCVIHAKSQFDAESFKSACPDIYHRVGMRDWSPFTIPIDPYFSELVWEFYASYRGRQQLMKQEGSTEVLMPSWNTSDVPIEVAILLACIMEHVHINGGEIIVDQFRRKAKQLATALPFPTLTYKEAPMVKRARYTGNMTPPSPLASSHITTVPANTDESQNSPAQIYSILHKGKRCMRINFRRCPYLLHPPINRRLVALRWCHHKSKHPEVPQMIGGWATIVILDIISNEKEAYHSLPPPPPMHAVYDVNPSWASVGVATTSYHELRTLPDRRVAPALVYLSHSHQIPCNPQQKTQLLGFLMLSLIRGSQGPIANMIRKSLLPSCLSCGFHWGKCLT